jgi:hypothetical protein
VWHPKLGTVYGPGARKGTGQAAATPLALSEQNKIGKSILVTSPMSQAGRDSEATMLVTLVPFAISPEETAVLLDKLDPSIENESENRIRFLPIAEEGLWTYDGHHLTYGSSLLATGRLWSILRQDMRVSPH